MEQREQKQNFTITERIKEFLKIDPGMSIMYIVLLLFITLLSFAVPWMLIMLGTLTRSYLRQLQKSANKKSINNGNQE